MVNMVNSDETGGKGPSIVVQAIIFMVLTAVAVGVGFGGGEFLFRDATFDSGTQKQATGGGAEQQAKAASKESHGTEKAGHGTKDKAEDAENGDNAELTERTIALEPIVTNILAPKDIWIRTELALVTKEPMDKILVDEIHQDLLTYIRTLQLAELEGASAFLDFKANLLDRARIRSGGKVENVLIKTLLYE